MKKEPTPRLSAETLESIKNRWDDESTRLGRAPIRLKCEGHVVYPGNILNALVCWYLEQPPADRERIAREGLACYEVAIAGPGSDALSGHSAGRLPPVEMPATPLNLLQGERREEQQPPPQRDGTPVPKRPVRRQ
jgi:hypothetical protein